MRSSTRYRILAALGAALAVSAALLVSPVSGAGAASAQPASLPTGPLVPAAGTSLLGVTITKGSKTSEPAVWTKLETAAGEARNERP